MKILGVEFAPVYIPFERRLQTVAAGTWFLFILFSAPTLLCISVYVLFFANVWLRLLALGYLLFVYYDQDTPLQGGRRKWITSRLRNLKWWSYYCDYFPIKIVKTADLDPAKNYLLCSFPHGVLASGVIGGFATNGANCAKLFPGLDFRVLTLDVQFKVPLYREFILNMGVCSCDQKSINHLLSTKPTVDDGPTEDPVTGRALILVVGGAAEAYKCKPKTYHILLKRRKGFVKVALKNGASLVPVFSFGETDLYDQVDNPKGSLLRKIQDFVKNITGIAPVVPLGRGFFQYKFGIIPHRSPINVVVGAPIDLPKTEKPTPEVVNKYHQIFTEKLIELFETHKSKYLKDHENISLVLDDC